MDGITPTMDLTRNDSFGGGSGIWLFAILALFLFGNGTWGGRANNVATEDDLNFGRLENQVRANAGLTENKFDYLNTQVATGFTQIGNGICTLGYEIANKFADTNERIANSTAQIKEMLCQNKIETLQNELSKLQLAQSLNGVIRYPSGTTYCVPSPCFNYGCSQNI